MGALADGFVAYAQPLLDQTDGSEEQLNGHSAHLGRISSSKALLRIGLRCQLTVWMGQLLNKRAYCTAKRKVCGTNRL
jgi:hypothetical protein